MGVLLGKASLIQLMCLATFECIIFSFNEYLCAKQIGSIDNGGAMSIHLFGALFGIFAAMSFN